MDINYKDYLVDPQTDRYFSDSDIRNENNFMHQRFDKSDKGDYYFGNTRLDDTYIKSYPRDGLFFDGKVILMINNRTFSAATYFASLLKVKKRKCSRKRNGILQQLYNCSMVSYLQTT